MQTVKTHQIMLLVGDMIILYVSLGITLLFRYGNAEFGAQLSLHLLPMTIIFGTWLTINYVNGLYDLYIAKPSQAFVRRFLESWIASVTIAVAMFYLLPVFNITPKTNLFILSIIFGILFLSWRFFSNNLASANIRILVINPTDDLIKLLNTLEHNKQFGYHISGIISDQETIDSPIERFSTTTPLRALVSQHQVNLIVVQKNSYDTFSSLYSELYELLFWNVYTIPSEIFFESLTGRIPLSALHDSWFFENLRPNRTPLYDRVQRAMDCILGLVGIIILFIITPLLALLIKMYSPGPIFYLQERIGRNGKRFRVIKFRTMHALTKDGGAETNGIQTTTNEDPRVIPFGKFIRNSRLDELPQVINILKGEMSFIGPRPERPQFVEQFEKHIPYYTVRNLVKPGLSGWAQINFSYAATVEEQLTKFQYDLYYIKNKSLMLDITIILKTLHVVIYGKGR